MPQAQAPSIDPADLARFEKLGADWWRADGPMAQLHKLNPVRLAFIRDEARRRFSKGGAQPLAGLDVLDIGCGGGILCEPLARLGGRVVGVDPGETNIGVASAHAAKAGLTIDYRCTAVEALAGETFDIVLAMEVVEHVADLDGFVAAACGRVRPGGLLFAATLNRTMKSFALAIVGAEYVLGWLPRGTHDWRKFVTPAELTRRVRASGLSVARQTGVAYNPLLGAWDLSSDMDVNYMIAGAREA